VQVIIVSGVPGAGKTTVSRLLAARFARSVHIEGDLIGHHFIVNGLVPPQGPPQDEAEAQLLLRRRNICALAGSFATAGFTTVIDDVVVSPSVLQTYRVLLAPRRFAFVQLAPSIGVIEQRDAGRDKQVFGIWGNLDAELRNWTPLEGLWLDTDADTPQQTVERILEGLDQADLG
jgi:predicted kinase